MKTTLYTAEQLSSIDKTAFNNAAYHLNEYRLSSDFDYESFAHQIECVCENATERLELMGFDIRDFNMYDNRGIDVVIQGSLTFIGDAIPYDFKNNINSVYKYEVKDFSPDEKKTFLEVKYLEHWNNSFIKQVLTDEEIELLDRLQNEFDYSIDFEVFDSYNNPLLCNIYKNSTGYESLSMMLELYNLEDRAERLGQYELEFLLAENHEDPDEFFETHNFDIWEIEKHFFKTITDIIDKKGSAILKAFIDDCENDYREEESFHYSLEYFMEYLENNFYYYSDFLFNIDGEFMCELDDLDVEEYELLTITEAA